MTKSCWSSYHELNLTTKGFLASCCMQLLEIEVDWSKITDLDEWFKNNKFLKRSRKQMASGIEIPECEACWEKEKDGYNSQRTRKNNKFISDFKNPTIRFLDLRLGNKCNLQCRMCNISDTDQLVKLGKELYDKGISDVHYDPTMYVKEIPKEYVLDLALKLPNLERIRFAGGEPFIMPEVETFLQKLIDANKTNIEIEFITNVTVVTDKMIKLLEQFEAIQISCSIDAIGDQLEYQRYPAKWSVIERNFKKLYEKRSDNFIIGLTPCVGLLNLTDLHKFLEWANKFPDARLVYNEVDNPVSQNLRYVPLRHRKALMDTAKTLKLENADPNWNIFLNKTIYEYLDPPVEHCNQLKHYSEKIWDYRCRVKFLDLYPWAQYMIEKADE